MNIVRLQPIVVRITMWVPSNYTGYVVLCESYIQQISVKYEVKAEEIIYYTH